MSNPSQPDTSSNPTAPAASDGDKSDLDRSFEAALRAAENAPASEDAWNHLEELADKLQRPDEVASRYRAVLETKLSPEVFRRMAERAVQFHDEWFGDNPERTTGLLQRILELEPSSAWAFEQLVVALTAAGQWDDLLAVYDRSIEAARDDAERRRLLDDAAQAAKDFAGQVDRAADYQLQLLALEPQNAPLAQSLERLLERSGRHQDRIALWESRLPALSPEQARETRLRIARCYRDELGDAARALEELRRLLDESPGMTAACQELESLVDRDGVDPVVRRQATSLLRKHYLVADRPEDVVRVLQRALAGEEAERSPEEADRSPEEAQEQRHLHRELATRLAILGRDLEALAQYRALLLIDPSDPDARKQSRMLAGKTGRHDLHAEALLAASEASNDPSQITATLLEVARLRHRELEDREGAATLYQRVLDTAEAEDDIALAAAHALEELLGVAGRDAERLAVLERLASLEPSAAVRRYVHGEAARLAESLGDVDRAIASWRAVLEDHGEDVEALGAIATLLEGAERWEDLVEALDARAKASSLPLQRRADLVRIAEVQTEKLGITDAAIATWLRVRKEFGEDRDTVTALETLMDRAGRHAELAHLLGGAALGERSHAAAMAARLGALHLELDDPEQAIRWFADALALEPDNEDAQAGLGLLLEAPDGVAQEAASVLDAAARRRKDWRKTLELLELRVGQAGDRREHAARLTEAARLHETKGADPEAALRCVVRSLPLEPENLATEAAVLRLAEQTGRWATAAASLRMAAEAASQLPGRQAELRRREGRIHEERLGDPGPAAEAYLLALAAAPDLETARAAARCAARAGLWEAAAEATVATVAARQEVPSELLGELEEAGRETGDFPGLIDALQRAISARPLPPAPTQLLWLAIAGWARDHLPDGEVVREAATRAADLRGPHRHAALELLAGHLRKDPGLGLVRTLLELDRASSDPSLDTLHEAARVALGLPDGAVLASQVLDTLYRKAARMWLHGEPTTGGLEPPSVAQWALEQLIAQHLEAGHVEQAQHLLLDAARLPLERQRALDLRRRAAELLAERGERSRAIDVYRSVLDQSPGDLPMLQRLAELCEAEGRASESLAFRLQEVALVEDVERRLELRLEHSRLTGEIEAQGGRVASLKANLAEAPGHARTLEELASVLDERGRHDELAAILHEQAQLLESDGDTARAAELYAALAKVAEQKLADPARAIAAHERVVELAKSHEALDALARLNLERDQPAAAASWLERRLENAAAQERVAVLLKLGRAQIAADKRDAAVAALRQAFDEAPKNAEVRKLLFRQYRAQKDHAELARALTIAALAVADEATVLGYAREAANLYHRRLDDPAASVPALKRAVELAPDDRELRGLLAEGLRAAGELDEARQLLERLIADFGRRRSPERAQAHLALARVLHALGEAGEALDQLDAASKMDASNATVLKALAELAQEAGQLDRAERALRTLLVTVRREKEPELLPIGPTEVLFDLSRIAADRGEPDKASELYDSVLESLRQHEFEAPRIQRKLKARGEYALLRKVLEHRLTYVDTAHRRARIHEQLAELFAGPLEDPAAALRARLDAVRTDPGSPVHHQAAWDQAASMGQLDAYVTVVETLLSDERADKSAHVRCELLLRLGEVLEKERGDLERASALYGQAEATGVRTVDVWRAQARVAATRGDSAEQMRILGELAGLGEDQAETRADALYRLAEVQLADAETIDDGLDALEKALADGFKAERAAMILRRASDEHVEHQGLLDVYETVARRSEDRRHLLHYLIRRAAHLDATPEQAREAVEVALELDEPARAETLMLRAAEIGHAGNRKDDLKRVDWALLGLAERRMIAGDLAGAVKWLGDATDVADLEPLLALGSRLAELAGGPDGDLTLAAKLYERLLERAPHERRVWEPLATTYARLGDTERLERMVEETLDGLDDPAARRALRVALARALMQEEERGDEAVTLLKGVLAEAPREVEPRRLLTAHLERLGRHDELLELLEGELRSAEEQGDGDAIKMLAIQLARRLQGDRRQDALAILRRAHERLPEDVELLEALLARLGDDDDPRERARLLEALLEHEEPGLAARRAATLVKLYDALEDEDGALRALRLGAERAPDDEGIQAELLERYRGRGDFAGLADVLLAAAGRAEQPHQRASLWRQAARVRRDELGDPGGAAELLRQAAEVEPQDAELAVELAQCLGAAGMHDQAVQTISEQLGDDDDALDASRAPLLLVRAELRTAAGHDAAAIDDLERAFGLQPDAAAEALESALTAAIDGAVAVGDRESERRYTLRAVDVMSSRGKRAEAAMLLRGWTSRHEEDVEALRRLRDMDTAEGAWRAVAETCLRLIHLEQGVAQVDAALGLSHAHQELGEPEGAREGLEHVRDLQPDSPQVRAELRKIYEQLGDQQELAKLLVGDAQLEEDPATKAEMLQRAGHIFVDLGDAVSAIPPLREAHQLVPQPSTVVPLADAYILAGWFDDAGDLLSRAIEAGRGRRSPEICVYYHRKAKVAEAQGDRARQLELLLEAHQSNKKNGLVAADLADLAESLEQWDLAARTLRTITLIDTQCPISRAEAFLRQGRIAHVQGDNKNAKMWARRAKREDPEWDAIDHFLIELGDRPSAPPGRG